MPLVSSRTMTKSVPLIISSLIGERSNKTSGTVIGRILANNFKALRRASNPFSGVFSTFSHFGPPIAPSKIASADSQASSVAFGKGSPQESIAAPPKSCASKVKVTSLFWVMTSNTSKALAMISGPIPSPANTTIFFSIIFPPLLSIDYLPLYRLWRKLVGHQSQPLRHSSVFVCFYLLVLYRLRLGHLHHSLMR